MINSELVKTNKEYASLFHQYYQFIGRNKPYARTFLKRMEKLEKSLKTSKQ